MAKKSKPPASPEINNITELDAHLPPQLEDRITDDDSPKVDIDHVFEDTARDNIYSKYDEQQKQADIDNSPDTVIEPVKAEEKGVEAEPVKADAPTAAAEPAVEEIPATPTEPEPTQKHKLLVNGQQLEYTTEELIQQAQLGIGARQKFDEAAQLRQQASLERQQAEALMFQARNSQPQQPAQQLQDIPDTELKDIAKRLNYGSEDDQVRALKDAIALGNKMGQPQLTPEALVNAATQNALAVLTQQQTEQVLRQEFSDILSDFPLSLATDAIANSLNQKYLALGQQRSSLDIFREAGTLAREKYLAPAATITPAPLSPTIVVNNDKIERKRAAPQPPAAASKIAPSPTNTSTREVSSEQAMEAMRREAFAEIAKSRGSQPY